MVAQDEEDSAGYQRKLEGIPRGGPGGTPYHVAKTGAFLGRLLTPKRHSCQREIVTARTCVRRTQDINTTTDTIRFMLSGVPGYRYTVYPG
eukprot:1464748-Rhodomonas_salina.1